MPTVINRDDIAKFIGNQAAPTQWHQITQTQINQFADCTLDHQFIHVDEEKAKATPFGATIAHGCRILLKSSVSLSTDSTWD